MAAKKQIKRADILDAALAIFREGGMDALNAREVASRAGCSTQPIYLDFDGMEGLTAELGERIKARYEDMTDRERRSLVQRYLGKTVTIGIDRPIGYVHRKGEKTLVYPINYGYIPGVLGGDGEELDVYLLGVDRPVKEYTARIVGIVWRRNDVEDKLIAAPEGLHFSATEMYEAVKFQEKYYDSYVEAE